MSLRVRAARTARPAGSAVLDLFPRGHALPSEVWATRHRWVTGVLMLGTALLPAFGWLRGFPPVHLALDVAGPALMVVLACVPSFGRRARSSLSSVGLMLLASIVVHLSGGAIEAHFLFFVLVPIVALYESWFPFGMAVGYVLFQHGVIGTLYSTAVYSHRSAQEHPWVWAAVHAGLFAASCLASMVSWRMHEQARATGLQLVEARAAMAAQAHTDPLTGLLNRLGLDAELERLGALAQTHGRSVSVALCDVDYFKAYNDTYGHQVGDQALRTIAAVLTGHLRSTDRVYRYGGEEFLVLLPEQDADQAAEAVERVRSRLEALAVEHLGAGPGAVLTMSAGLATSAPDHRLTSAQLVAHADAALYSAKHAGRNRTALAAR